MPMFIEQLEDEKQEIVPGVVGAVIELFGSGALYACWLFKDASDITVAVIPVMVAEVVV